METIFSPPTNGSNYLLPEIPPNIRPMILNRRKQKGKIMLVSYHSSGPCNGNSDSESDGEPPHTHHHHRMMTSSAPAEEGIITGALGNDPESEFTWESGFGGKSSSSSSSFSTPSSSSSSTPTTNGSATIPKDEARELKKRLLGHEELFPPLDVINNHLSLSHDSVLTGLNKSNPPSLLTNGHYPRVNGVYTEEDNNNHDVIKPARRSKSADCITHFVIPEEEEEGVEDEKEGRDNEGSNNGGGGGAVPSILKKPLSSDSLPSLLIPPSSGSLGPRRVTFADDSGRELVSVRTFSERAELESRFKEMERQDSEARRATSTSSSSKRKVNSPKLMLCFAQPASNYMAFRARIAEAKVSLENVLLRDYVISGRVRVNNIAFHKKVFLRVTYDHWMSHEDELCSYDSSLGRDVDIFSFSFNSEHKLIDPTSCIEFCVAYQAEGVGEFWDSHGGTNYRICQCSPSAEDGALGSPNGGSSTDVIAHAASCEPQTTWSEFSVWKAQNSGHSYPYW